MRMMKRIHENADMSGKTDSSCDGEMLPAKSIDPAYHRYECELCHAGISIKRKEEIK